MVRVVDPKGGLPAPTVPGKRPDEQLQFIIALNMDDWEHMCRVVKPDDTKVGAIDGGGGEGKRQTMNVSYWEQLMTLHWERRVV